MTQQIIGISTRVPVLLAAGFLLMALNLGAAQSVKRPVAVGPSSHTSLRQIASPRAIPSAAQPLQPADGSRPRQEFVPLSASDSGAPLYDDFNRKWLNPAKWDPLTPNCWGNVLECVRQIRNGKLYLSVRNFGNTDSDTGINWTESEAYFRNQSAVQSITAEMTLLTYQGEGCSTNSSDRTHTQVRIGGTFFNSGSGDPFDDVTGLLILWVDTLDPTTISVGGWWGWEDQGYWNYIASYPVGTPLTGSISWDKANHRFLASVKSSDGTGGSVVMPYALSDSTPAANGFKQLDASAHTLNCTTGQTFGQVEATYDNVIVK